MRSSRLTKSRFINQSLKSGNSCEVTYKTFEVVMLTRKRYRCAGWHIREKGYKDWEIFVPGKEVWGNVHSLERAMDCIHLEYEDLFAEVGRIEKERKYSGEI